jgi:surfactin synthase thioesterase subunit/glycosyltransferase involved in cell wall biosynthesis
MRILLTSNAPYSPPRGGSTRSNLTWLGHLAQSGHECVVVCPTLDSIVPDTETIHASGIRIMSVRELSRRTSILSDQISSFRPDWVLVSSEDVAHVLLREAHHAAPGRLVYLAHTPQFYPFGPASWNPDPQAALIVKQAARVVAIGQHMAGYIREHLGRDAAVVHPPIYGQPPFPQFTSFDRGWISMINPSVVKGIQIFLALADAFPDYPFAALAGWATTADDREQLLRRRNVMLLESVPNIDDVLSQSRLLLMPSLWYEGFGLIAMEAMLRGLPVVASDSGGLREAKHGTGYVIPVRAIDRFEPVFDETHMPKAVEAQQDIGPWKAALHTLLTDEPAYRKEADASRDAAVAFVANLRAADFEDMLVQLQPRPARMRVLLAHNSTYYPSHGGGDKSNRLLMEALAERGHEVRVVTRVERFGIEEHERLLAQLVKRGVQPDTSEPGGIRLSLNGVDVRVLTTNPHLREFFAHHVSEFEPDIIITSTDDPGQLLFDLAIKSRARVVHLVRATIAVPFGPESSAPNPSKTAALQDADGVIGVSEYVASYVRQWSGMEAVHVPISLLDKVPEYPNLGSFGNRFVTIANPCAVKGIAIFLELADRMPDVEFAAVPTWGTTRDDLDALTRRKNITVLTPFDNIDDLLRITKVLLVPSVWAEARSRLLMEAMSRGVPVIASDIGGIREAHLGVDYLIPIRPITHYHPQLDMNMVPIAEVPPQNVDPWEKALRRLLTDNAHFEELSARSREAGLGYARNLNVLPFERFLQDVRTRPKKTPKPAVDRLSEDKKKLLALRLRRKTAASSASASPWFSGLEDHRPGRTLLFCFPYAGGGTMFYRSWRDRLAEVATVCAVRLPGRESRLNEPPFERMGTLVDALAGAIVAHIDTEFVFFGHSMGAAIAFELARRYPPRALYVSAARAPRFRLNYEPPPEPDDSTLIDELRRLEGMPADVLESEELMQIALPAIRADSKLYRNYRYEPGERLDVPIFAYRGANDPHIRREHIGPWADETTAEFRRREFPGGHFFIQTAPEWLDALAADLRTGR